jgi:hypothetical protein
MPEELVMFSPPFPMIGCPGNSDFDNPKWFGGRLSKDADDDENSEKDDCERFLGSPRRLWIAM